MSKLRLPINCKSLELELQEALKADELYRLQNDAKLRAVEQNVSTYEDFRQMVNVAHLKPMEHADFKPVPKRPWNPIADMDNSNMVMLLDKINEKGREDCLKVSSKEDNTFQGKIPTTYQEFVQTWKMIRGCKAKFHYIKILRYTLREKIFRAEIPSSLLVELIDICFQNVSIIDHIEPIIDILRILSKCNRFCLAVSFMKENEREICRRLFRELLINVNYQNEISKDTIKVLALNYKVKFE
ncbi:Coiled-coil domain-containing protein 103 [Anthophora retusa]